MLTKRVEYEWAVETKDEYGDIQDVDFSSSFPDLVTIDSATDVALIRNIVEGEKGNFDDTAYLIGRGYAYVGQGGALPEFFDDGHRVPKRFHKEIA